MLALVWEIHFLNLADAWDVVLYAHHHPVFMILRKQTLSFFQIIKLSLKTFICVLVFLRLNVHWLSWESEMIWVSLNLKKKLSILIHKNMKLSKAEFVC